MLCGIVVRTGKPPFFHQSSKRSVAMAKHENVLGRLAVVLMALVTMGLLFSPNPITVAEEEQRMTANEEYLVLGRDKTPEAVFYNATTLENLLNTHAKQGWKLRAAATMENPYLILARPTSSR
jgi:hypothetical protein